MNNENVIENCIKSYDNILSSRHIENPKKEALLKDSRLIVTISSWNKRINNVAPVIKSILANTIVPNEIVLNLARPDFGVEDDTYPNLESLRDVFPEELINLLYDYKIIRIHWYNDSKLTSWKKHLYVMQHSDKDDIIICIDDDILYKSSFIETMLKSFNFYGREFPITSMCGCMTHGVYPFIGNSMLYCPKFFGDFSKFISPEIVHMTPEDNHLLNILICNKHIPMPVVGSYFLFDVINYNEGEVNYGNGVFNDEWFNNLNIIMKESYSLIRSAMKGAPELDGYWQPLIFNFSQTALEDYLKRYKEKHKDKGGILEIVYDSIEYKLNNCLGTTSKTGLEKSLSNIQLD